MDFNHQTLEIITNLAVIASVVGSPIVFFMKRELDKRSNRKNAGFSILREIEGIERELKGNGESNSIKYTCGNGKEIKFYPVFMGYAGFQSSIQGGHYTLFSKDLQKILNDLYLRMKLNNDNMEKSQDIVLFTKQQEIGLGTEKYFDLIVDVWIQLTKIQKELLSNIGIAKNKINVEI